jgi:VWFA-related protein
MGKATKIRLTTVLAVLVSLLAPQAYSQAQQDEEVFNIDIRTDLVELFLNVRNRGGWFIDGLSKEDFIVYDDGDARELAFFESEEYPVSVVMLLDTSGSMAESVAYLQTAASTFLTSLREQDRVALYSFGGMLKELSPFTKEKLKLVDRIDRVYADGGTPLYDAVVRGVRLLTKETGRKAILLFTDGADTTSRLSYESVARRCGRSSVPVFTVGCGQAVKNHAIRKLLDALSENSGGQSIYVENTMHLERAFARISDVLRTTYHAGYYTNRQPDGKWHDVSVELKSGRWIVFTRNGYYAVR